MQGSPGARRWLRTLGSMRQLATPRFEVLINGRKACVAGVSRYGVLSVVLTRVKRSPERFPGRKQVRYTKRTWSREKLDVHVGGLEINGKDQLNDRNLVWLRQLLKPGDTVVVRVLSVGPVSKPRFESPRRPPRASPKRVMRRKHNAA